jgi:hypothetical protein
MALATREESTYNSPSAFFEAMNFGDNNTMNTDMLQFNHLSQFQPLKTDLKDIGPLDPLLNTNCNADQFDDFNLSSNYWNEPSRFGSLDAINPTLSPLDGNQSCDTGYVSQEGSSKSPATVSPLLFADKVVRNASSITPNSRKRSSTKTTASRQSDAKPSARKARRTSRTASIDVMLDEEDGSKREQFLARNREAASKCRQKKKEWTTGLEDRARELSAQKQVLTTYLAMLKNELLMLKCKCLEHSDCGCEGIRDYLKNTVNTMPPANAALYSKLDGKGMNDLSSEIARKQSAFDMSVLSPVDMVTPPNSDGDMDGDNFMRLESELKAAAND